MRQQKALRTFQRDIDAICGQIPPHRPAVSRDPYDRRRSKSERAIVTQLQTLRRSAIADLLQGPARQEPQSVHVDDPPKTYLRLTTSWPTLLAYACCSLLKRANRFILKTTPRSIMMSEVIHLCTGQDVLVSRMHARQRRPSIPSA